MAGCRRIPLRSLPEHAEFVDRAVSALSQDGRVVCVRLVLLAQLLRSRPWTLATLAELGGARTIGATILDEAFSSPQAPPQNRLHRRAAQAVLKQLLPEGGGLIKGHVSSRQALLDVSGYSAQPREFQELMWVLDHELRLVTPADPLFGAEESDVPAPEEGPQYYQLTHDYLIPDLRRGCSRTSKSRCAAGPSSGSRNLPRSGPSGTRASFSPRRWNGPPFGCSLTEGDGRPRRGR